jgi:hypothetical integral membrane protein (TIGR02206 family)
VEVATAQGQFEAFAGSHVTMLVVFVLGIGAVVGWGRHHRGQPQERARRRLFAVLIAVFAAALQVYQFTPNDYSLQTSWPFQLCDVAVVAVVLALWTRGARATAFTYYVGLTLTVQAIVTPALDSDFPDPRFVAFWGMHMGIVWAGCYLTWGLGWRPTWRLWVFSVGVTALWAVSVVALNLALGTNYGYLMRKPSTASVLDLLGPWPWYVLVEVVVISLFWLLVMTLPWQVADARRRRAAEHRTG